jgi:proline iminopeptidase
LESAYSDQPDERELWEISRFVEEVETMRVAPALDSDDVYLLGQAWGGLLAIEYALRYQQHIKGLVISNTMGSMPAYNAYSGKGFKLSLPVEVLNDDVLNEIEALEASEDYQNRRY